MNDQSNCEKQRHKFVCDMCFPDAKEWGEILSGYYLVERGGSFFIIGGHGHNNDVVIAFNEKPSMNPDSDNSNNHSEDFADAWFEVASAYELKLPPIETYRFIHACVGCGYTTDKMIMPWIYSRAGELIQYVLSGGTKTTPNAIGNNNETEWDYRVTVEEQLIKDSKCKTEKLYGIREVYYEGEKPVSCAEEPIILADSVAELRIILGDLQESVKRPVLFKADLEKTEEEAKSTVNNEANNDNDDEAYMG